MKFAHCLRMVFIIGKYTEIYRGEGFCSWGGFPFGGISLGEVKFHGGGEFSTENFTLGI